MVWDSKQRALDAEIRHQNLEQMRIEMEEDLKKLSSKKKLKKTIDKCMKSLELDRKTRVIIRK